MTPEDESADDLTRSMAVLLDLQRRARLASSSRELSFLLANESHALCPYRQAVLWLADKGVHTLSGLVQVEANAPYVLWLRQVCEHLSRAGLADQQTLSPADLPAALAEQWQEWWPAHLLYLSLPIGPRQVLGQASQAGPEGPTSKETRGAASAILLLVREQPWQPGELALLKEWCGAWAHAYAALTPLRIGSLRAIWQMLSGQAGAQQQQQQEQQQQQQQKQQQRRWWQQPLWRWGLGAALLLALPVRLTVLAPGELVPAHPVVIRAPLDGVLATFQVQPNQMVKRDQPLFGFDEALIQSRMELAGQSLVSAQTEYRQSSQQALNDPRFRPQLAMLSGKIDEKRTELDFLGEQLKRARVLAPTDGMVLFDDPSEWIGRPVVVGERIMRIAASDDKELEAWLPIADAIAFQAGSAVKLYLNADPLAAVSARLRYVAHDAVQRPDGSFAYRVRATLDGPTEHRVGLKGSAKLQGDWVPLIYWVMRRPLATLRSSLGL